MRILLLSVVGYNLEYSQNSCRFYITDIIGKKCTYAQKKNGRITVNFTGMLFLLAIVALYCLHALFIPQTKYSLFTPPSSY